MRASLFERAEWRRWALFGARVCSGCSAFDRTELDTVSQFERTVSHWSEFDEQMHDRFFEWHSRAVEIYL